MYLNTIAIPTELTISSKEKKSRNKALQNFELYDGITTAKNSLGAIHLSTKDVRKILPIFDPFPLVRRCPH